MSETKLFEELFVLFMFGLFSGRRGGLVRKISNSLGKYGMGWECKGKLQKVRKSTKTKEN